MRTEGGEAGRWKFGYSERPAAADTYNAGDILQNDAGNGRLFKNGAAGIGVAFVPYDQTVAVDGQGLVVMKPGTSCFCKFKAACEVGILVEPSDGNAGEAMAYAGASPENVCGITMEAVTDTTHYFEVEVLR
jgi:hypothetical protein